MNWATMSIEELEKQLKIQDDTSIGVTVNDAKNLIQALITVKGHLAGSKSMIWAQEKEIAELRTQGKV